MTVPAEEAPANYVPAAAVIRRVQALIGITGRKECAGGSVRQDVKSQGLTWELHCDWRARVWQRENGIPGVAVKCVDIRRNTDGEGSSPGQH